MVVLDSAGDQGASFKTVNLGILACVKYSSSTSYHQRHFLILRSLSASW